MLRSMSICMLSFVTAASVHASIEINDGSPSYSQNFNTLASSVVSTAVPPGWAFLNTGQSAPATYYGSDGSLNLDGVYSYGQTSTDRAFGMKSSSSLFGMIGFSFSNDGTAAIESLSVSYFGEKWRDGNSPGSIDRLDFQYSLNATSLSSGTWIDADGLDFASPATTGVSQAVDGNSDTFRTSIASTISSVNASPGSTVWIRWRDVEFPGVDDGLGVDDFSMSANFAQVASTPEPSALAVWTLLATCIGLGSYRRWQNLSAS